jgi:hypothetical protein
LKPKSNLPSSLRSITLSAQAATSMARKNWKSNLAELLNGVQRELGSTIPAKTKLALNSLRKELKGAIPARKRKRFERELGAFLHSTHRLRTATRKYLRKKAFPALKDAASALKRATFALISKA